MSKLRLHGTSSGYTDIAPTAAAGNNTLTAPTGTGTIAIEDSSGNVTIADGLVHTGDTNTKIRFPSADTVTVETGGSERARITSDGDMGVGTGDAWARLVSREDSSNTSITGHNYLASQSGIAIDNGSTTTGSFNAYTSRVKNAGGTQQSASLAFKSTASGYTPEIHLTQRTGSGAQASRLIINSAGGATFSGITTAQTFVPTEYQLGNRNLLHNGAMQVAQRSTQVTGCTADKYRTCDRWRAIMSNGGTYTVEQTDEGPADTGFNHAFRFTCTTADNAGQNNLGNADGIIAMEQRLEGYDVQGIQKGTTSAKKLTLTFWCKSNNTGTYNIELFDNDNQRRVGFQYTVSSSGTWEQKRFTFPAEANSTYPLGNDNGDSLRVRWFLAAGNNWRTGTNSGSWAANTTNQRAQNNTSLSKATNNYFALTGCQLEVGDQPTPFEWISYAEDLAKCQRYYYRAHHQIDSGERPLCLGAFETSSQITTILRFPVTMRTTPSLSATGSSSWMIREAGTSHGWNTFSLRYGTPQSAEFVHDGTAVSGTAGRVGMIRGTGTSSKLEFSADL